MRVHTQGPADKDPAIETLAEELGKAVAEAGYVLLTGARLSGAHTHPLVTRRLHRVCSSPWWCCRRAQPRRDGCRCQGRQGVWGRGRGADARIGAEGA